jgi:hypothetical protein
MRLPSTASLLACLLVSQLLGNGAPAQAAKSPPGDHSSIGVASAGTNTQRSLSSLSNSNTPVPVAPSDTPPAGRRLSANQVLAIASALPKMRKVRREYRGSYGGAYLKGPGRWQVSYFSRNGKKEIGQVVIEDFTGRVVEQWTGFQVAWTMARGYPGAFGRHVNALYVWLPMCVLFFIPFVRWRKPFSLLHLDLLVLLSFSASLAFFNHGRIYASVPLVYPPLLYLLARMLAIARIVPKRSRVHSESSQHVNESVVVPAPAGPDSSRPRLVAYEPRLRRARYSTVPVAWLLIGVIFLIGFRVGLNIADSNVIDVGYAGVIGAHKIVEGKPLYGKWPVDNEHGDTYGPASYESYIPFVQLFGWSGKWDQLPAAHAAAIFFDLLATGLMFLLGMRLDGRALGTSLAYAWVSYPFTLFALESNSNDTIVAVLVLAALLLAARPLARGAAAAAGALSKFAPFALAPILATHGLQQLAWARRTRMLAMFTGAFILVGATLLIPALTHDSPRVIYQRTVAYQMNRGSPFSVWGLYGNLGGLQAAVEAGALVLAVALALVPRRVDVFGLAAVCAAVLIALQLGVEHWFYLYIPWFFAPAMVALLAGADVRGRPAADHQAGRRLRRPLSYAAR